MQPSGQWLRRILAYTTLFSFIVFVFLYGVAESLSGMGRGFRPFNSLGKNQGLNSQIPDFSHYEYLRNISAEHFPIDDPIRRVIITGDLHGMMKPLENLLDDLNYSSEKDVFIHVGDIVTRGRHKNSMTLLKFLTANNVTGVRGNNDQKVVEWRGWLNWIASLPGGKGWLHHLESISPDIKTNESKLIQWMKDQRNAASRNDKRWWRLIPHGWVLFSDHFKVARDMSATEFQYLLDLPLRLYVPSVHVFIVHAGLLPLDPQYPYYDKRQPLARMPRLEGINADTSKLNKTRKEVERLRNAQDLSMLTMIPQNSIPWVILNMRSIINGKVSKESKAKTPWSDLWAQEMDSCVGYNHELVHDAFDGDEDGKLKGVSGSRKDSKRGLPCYPSTVVYGHAASRGLDVKRWSIGLDSGCVYGRKLSALVIGGPKYKPKGNVDSDQGDNEEAPDDYELIENHGGDDFSAAKQSASFRFSDHAIARIRTVKCQR